MIYRTYAPHPQLARHLECLWYLRLPAVAGGPPDRVLPDGCCELIFNLRAPFLRASAAGRWARQPAAMFVGQISRHLLLQATGDVEILAVRFKPAGAHAIFRFDLDELTDGQVALDQLDAGWRELARRVGDAPTTEARVRVIESELRRRLGPDPLGPLRATAALDLLRADESPGRVEAVATAVGLSTRQLERTFRREIGLTPKHYARLLRFRRIFDGLNRNDPQWADLAARLGYSDQPHLVREFREFAGLAPRAYFAGQTAFAAALLT